MNKLCKKLKIILLLSCYFISFGIAQLNAQELSATEIVKKSFNLLLGKSSISELSMTITRPEWSRTITMQSWSLGDEYYMILITAPARDKGQVFMKRKNDMWNWMPSINRMIKIPPSMMTSSWMGSDFTNDDLVRENSIVEDYTHRIIDIENINDYECYKIELIPHPEAPVVWGKINLWVSKNEFYQLKAEFYDDYMQLVNISESFEIKQMGDRKLPSVMTMHPVKKQGHKTELKIISQKFNIPAITESFFSMQHMKNIRAR